MIESVVIRKFQKHKRTKLELSEGVNVISGASDQGKSSIIRALKWCFLNRPSGFRFKRWGTSKQDKTIVRVRFSNGEVERRRGAVENSYVVNGELLKAIRSDVPDQVKNLVNIDGRNFHDQHDGYFLLQDSSGEVARKFNEIVGLDIIDKALKNAASIINNLKSEETVLANEKREFTTADPNKQNLSRCIQLADIVLQNNGNLDELHKQLKDKLVEVV